MDITHTPIRMMEPAIIARLREAFPTKDFRLERIPQTLTLKEFDRIAQLSPFIGLAWTGFKPDGENGRIAKGDMMWRLVLVFKASNTLETRFKGDRLDLGLDAMVDVAIVVLNGAVFDGIGTSQVTLANSIIADGWSDDKLVIAQVDFTVKFSAGRASLQLRTSEDFERLGITWHVDPEVEGAPAPADTHEQED